MKDQYVVVTDEDFRQANVKPLQTVEIVSFVEAGTVAPYYFETPVLPGPASAAKRVMRCCATCWRARDQ